MSAFLIDRRNDALDINRSDANRNLTDNGSNWLWAVTTVMGLTFLAFLGWTISRNKQSKGHGNDHSKKSNFDDTNNGGVNRQHHVSDASPLSSERVFHYLWTIAAFIAFISYFTMASNLGNTPVRQHMNFGLNPLQTRSVFYVRYIYYVTAWPLVLIANLILSGVSWATILFIVALQEIWVVSWLCGALVESSYKWGYFAFGVFAYLVLSYLMLTWGLKHSNRIGAKKDYTLLAGLLVLAWALFPIAWGLSEGSNRLSVTGEMIFYGILDLVAIPIYGTLFLLLASKRFAPDSYRFTQTGRVHGSEYGTATHSTGHSNGHSTTAHNNGMQGGGVV